MSFAMWSILLYHFIYGTLAIRLFSKTKGIRAHRYGVGVIHSTLLFNVVVVLICKFQATPEPLLRLLVVLYTLTMWLIFRYPTHLYKCAITSHRRSVWMCRRRRWCRLVCWPLSKEWWPPLCLVSCCLSDLMGWLDRWTPMRLLLLRLTAWTCQFMVCQ